MFENTEQVKIAHAEHGGFFFSAGAIGGFSSVIDYEVYGGKYFITREWFPWEHAHLFTVRQVSEDGSDISKVGEFGGYHTRAQATRAIERLLAGEEQIELPLLLPD